MTVSIVVADSIRISQYIHYNSTHIIKCTCQVAFESSSCWFVVVGLWLMAFCLTTGNYSSVRCPAFVDQLLMLFAAFLNKRAENGKSHSPGYGLHGSHVAAPKDILWNICGMVESKEHCLRNGNRIWNRYGR